MKELTEREGEKEAKSRHSHKWILELLRHKIKVVPACVGEYTRVEGDCYLPRFRAGPLEGVVEVLGVAWKKTQS